MSDDVEILLCMDLAEGAVAVPSNLREQDRVLWTGGRRGAPVARNLGVRAARAEHVAFLDDDDEWVLDKLERQMQVAAAIHGRGLYAVVSTQHVQVAGAAGRTSAPVPIQTYDGNMPVSQFLFRRRRPGGGRASMYTSTLLVSRVAAERVPWDESLVRHQDWDWLIRLDAEQDVAITQTSWVGTIVHSGSSGSLSASADWRSSLVWADRVLPSQPPGVYQDFLVAQTARYAVAARSFKGLGIVVMRVARTRRPPAIGPLLIALAAILPRSVIERLMARIR